MDIFADLEARLSLLAHSYSLHQGKLYKNPDLIETLKNIPAPLIAPGKHSIEGGEKPLKRKLAEVFLAQAGRHDEIVLCNGGTHGLSLCFNLFVHPGKNRVHVISPYWMYLPGVIEQAGGQMDEIAALHDGALVPEPQLLALIESRLGCDSAALYLAVPANPLGNYASDDFVMHLIGLCERHDIALIVDHAYSGFGERDTDTEHLAPLPDLYQHARVSNVFTFSKLMGIPGARLGFIHSSATHAAHLERLYRNTNYTLNSFSQTIAHHFLLEKHLISERRRLYFENLHLTRAALNGHCPLPSGGFFAFLPLPGALTLEDLLNAGIGVVDGRLFGAHYASYVRLCFTSEPPQRLKECLALLTSLIAREN
ncbi:pyridoxal phosphate-dependent aminotransferase [Pseudomonas sp. LF090]